MTHSTGDGSVCCGYKESTGDGSVCYLGELGDPVDTIIYGYTDSQWGDLLTSYDGTTITSDAIGNMLNDGTWTYTWEHGRRLKSMTDGEESWRFGYNAEGMRIRRVSEELNTPDYDYYYCDGKLSRMVIDGGIEMLFFYGADGRPTSLIYHGTRYYYVTNLQGDVVAILDTSGELVEYYVYSAWGELVSYPISEVGSVNPLLYRGYIYDWETGLYYVSSRYYDPEIGRWINADNQLSTGSDLTGMNLFAYCGNNPVNRIDPTGEAWWHWALGAAVVAACAVATVITCGGFAAAATAVCMVGSGVAAATTASTVAAGAFIGSATVYVTRGRFCCHIGVTSGGQGDGSLVPLFFTEYRGIL